MHRHTFAHSPASSQGLSRSRIPSGETAVRPSAPHSAGFHFTVQSIMQLQQTAGNRFVSRFVRDRLQVRELTAANRIQRTITIKGAEKPEYEPDELVDLFIRTKKDVVKLLSILDSDEERQATLRQAIRNLDSMSFDSMRQFQKQVIREVKNVMSSSVSSSSTTGGPTVGSGSAPSRGAVIGKSKGAFAKGVEPFFVGQNKDAIYYKLGLVVELSASFPELAGVAEQLVGLMRRVAERIEVGAIGKAGVEKTLSTLLSHWSDSPTTYMDEYRSKGGRSMLGGELVTLRGLIGELNALYYASLADRDDGEIVFSGSTYKDEAAGVEEDVDVSYIDSNGVLHLIECAANGNVLKNKLQGSALRDGPPKSQKQRYQHLANKASTLTQESIDPLTGPMGADREIAGVVLEYSIPPAEFEKMVENKELLEQIARGLVGNMRLVVGTEAYTREELQKLAAS